MDDVTGDTADDVSDGSAHDTAHDIAHDTAHDIAARDKIIERFRMRARRLRLSATLSLVLILVAIGGGMYLFVFAGEIASREANITLDRLSRSTETISTAVSEVQPDVEEILARLSDVLQALVATLASTSDIIADVDLVAKGGALVSIQGPLDEKTADAFRVTSEQMSDLIATMNVTFSEVHAVTRESAGAVRSMSSEISAAMSSLTSVLQTLENDMRDQINATFGDVLENAANQSDQVQTTLLVSTLSTRIGAMLLIIFLVQILVNLYRYSTRLASFYEGRADALEIAPSPSAAGFTELIHAISPDNLDFGKTPASPAEHAVTLAREVLARQGR